MPRTMLVLTLIVMGASPVMAASATANITGTTPESTVSGQAKLIDTDGGLQVEIRLEQVPSGTHGLHIHQHGSCEDAGNAAGGHFNPSGTRHGFLPEDGPANAHPGDMGNIRVGEDGLGTLSVTLPGVSLREGAHAVEGRAIVLHEKEDDFSQPTGNAGGRIGCGVIRLEVPGT